MPKKFESETEAVFNMAFLLKINQKKMKRLEKVYTFLSACFDLIWTSSGVHKHEVQREGGRD